MPEEPRQYSVKLETKTIIEVILFGLLIVLLYILRDIVLVLLTSIVIASFIESVVRKFKKYKIPRTAVVVGVYLISMGFLLGIFYLFVPIFLTEASSLVASFGDFVPSDSVLQNLQGPTLSNTKELVSDISSNASIGEFLHSAQDLVNGVSGGFIQTASIVFGGLLNVVLIAVITFYLSVQERGIEYFLRVITPIKTEEYIINLWERTERKIGLWMQGQMLLGVLIGILMYLGLTVLGIKYSLIIALLAALFELIPFGIILASIIGMVFAFVDGGFLATAKVAILFTIVQQFENYLIAPLIVKKVIGISPLVVILSVLIGAKLAGVWGVVLAIPVAVCLLEYLSDVEKGKSIRYTS